MIAHSIPRRRLVPSWWCRSQKSGAMRVSRRLSGEGQDGPVRVPLHTPPGCKRTRFGAGNVPRGVGARRLRRTLLSSCARPAGPRCRRQCTSRRNPSADYRLSALFRTAQQFALSLYGTSETLKIDTEGRVVLAESLKAHAGITDAATFVGLGHKFRIWEPGRFRAELAEATEKVRAFNHELGARMTAAKPLGARE